jgi:hypothetical protein
MGEEGDQWQSTGKEEEVYWHRIEKLLELVAGLAGTWWTVMGARGGLGIGDEKTWPNIVPLSRKGATLLMVIEL